MFSLVVDDINIPLPSEDILLSLGRSPDNNIVCHDTSASRRHAELRQKGGRLEIRDLNSTNGTRVNRAKLPPMLWKQLHPGHEIRIGEYVLRVELSKTQTLLTTSTEKEVDTDELEAASAVAASESPPRSDSSETLQENKSAEQSEPPPLPVMDLPLEPLEDFLEAGPPPSTEDESQAVRSRGRYAPPPPLDPEDYQQPPSRETPQRSAPRSSASTEVEPQRPEPAAAPEPAARPEPPAALEAPAVEQVARPRPPAPLELPGRPLPPPLPAGLESDTSAPPSRPQPPARPLPPALEISSQANPPGDKPRLEPPQPSLDFLAMPELPAIPPPPPKRPSAARFQRPSLPPPPKLNLPGDSAEEPPVPTRPLSEVPSTEDEKVLDFLPPPPRFTEEDSRIRFQANRILEDGTAARVEARPDGSIELTRIKRRNSVDWDIHESTMAGVDDSGRPVLISVCRFASNDELEAFLESLS